MYIKQYHGWIIISDIINGYYTTRKYMYYTKREAIAMFKKDILRDTSIIYK